MGKCSHKLRGIVNLELMWCKEGRNIVSSSYSRRRDVNIQHNNNLTRFATYETDPPYKKNFTNLVRLSLQKVVKV